MIYSNNNNNNSSSSSSSSSSKIETITHSRLFVSALLVLALMPDLTFGRYGSCGRSYYRYGYPHQYNSNAHWGGCWGGGWGGSCGRRYYNPLFYLMDAGLNSLTRQERRSSSSNTGRRRRLSVQQQDKSPLDYHLEDHGARGLELTVRAPGFEKAHEMDLDVVSTTNGEHTLSVRGTPGVRFSRVAKNPEISQSFLVHDDTIDVDDIEARLDAGILTISLPRKSKKRNHRTTRIVPTKSRDGDEILVFDAKRQTAARKNLAVNKALSKSSSKKKKRKQHPEDEEDDDGLWISEAEDIW